MHVPINPSKLSYCSLDINCYFTDITFFIFVPSKQHDHLSSLQLSTLIDKNPIERYMSMLETENIDWDSFQFEVEALDETKVNMINLLFNVISDLDLNFVCIKYGRDKKVVSEQSNLWLLRGLDGRFNEIQQSMIYDIRSSHNSDSKQLKKLKSCCHHSLRDLCVHTDVAWWKMKKCSLQNDNFNYPDGCIISLKSFFVGCVSVVKKATQIVKMEGDENDEEIIECMVCLLQVIFIL